MDHSEFEKAKSFIIVGIIDYVPNSIVIKTIIKKITGNVTAVSVDKSEALKENISPFDTFIQLLDGRVDVIIDGECNSLEIGQSIIVPAREILLKQTSDLKCFLLLSKVGMRIKGPESP